MKKKNTEELILESAKKIFIEKGKDGAKMQEIADRAGINKSLLHYYFRSKEKLFQIIVKDALVQFLPNIETIFCSKKPFEIKIKEAVNLYLTMLYENPFIPSFIIHEINRAPESTIKLITSSGIQFNVIIEAIEKDLKLNLSTIKPSHFLINLLSLCIFPIVTAPLISKIIFHGNKTEFDQFIEERKSLVSQFIINTLKI